jgi:hypothetical protein
MAVSGQETPAEDKPYDNHDTAPRLSALRERGGCDRFHTQAFAAASAVVLD